MKKFPRLSVLIALMLLVSLLMGMTASAQAPGKYNLQTEGIRNAYYGVYQSGGVIGGIVPGTTAQSLLNTCVPAGGTASHDTLATGSTITVTGTDDQGNPITQTLSTAVTGDINGDAAVTITDMLGLKAFLLGAPASELSLIASDVNFDGGVTITDFLQVKSCLLGLSSISSGRCAWADSTDPMLLAMPNTSVLWAEGMVNGTVAFASDDETLATIDITGTVTTYDKEGSTFVYALDADGNVLARTMVTVMAQDLTISLNTSAVSLAAGQIYTFIPYLNHPVTAPITWASSDPSIVAVNPEGTVSAINYGTVTITASLENGSVASATVTVIPPITGIGFYDSLYKIKPGASRTIPLWLDPPSSGEQIIWETSDPSIATVDAAGTVTGVNYGTVTLTATGAYSGLSASCSIKICDVKQVAITFDDGPSTLTPRLLDFLKENDIEATFFLVGNRIPEYSDIVQRQVAEGHEVGYHSLAHVEQTTISSERITNEFQYSNQLLMDLTGCGFSVWRTPGGGFNDRVLQAVPLPHIMWSVDTLDWKHRDADKVYWNIVNQSFDGAIILLHDLYGSTVNGAIRAMEEMNAGDYEFLTVTQLLSRNGTAPAASTTYYKG